MPMEMRSEPGFLSGRESFSISVPKSSMHSLQGMQNMQLIYAPDGTAIYKPLASASPPAPPPPYQGGGGGGGAGAAAGDGAPPAVPLHGLNISLGEPVKRKRGRPRKYGPDGSMALAPTPVSSASPLPPGAGAGAFSPSPAGSTKPASSTPSKSNKKRGRPPGSGKKQQMAALGNNLSSPFLLPLNAPT